MNRDDIIRMAQECYLIGVRPHLDGIYQDSLERFAHLVAAEEREACARMCEAYMAAGIGREMAAAIRARSDET